MHIVELVARLITSKGIVESNKNSDEEQTSQDNNFLTRISKACKILKIFKQKIHYGTLFAQ